MTFKIIISLFLQLILVFNMILPACANELESNKCKVSQVKTVENIDIPNFSKLDDNFYRSGQPEGEDYKKLSELGIKTIINLRLSGFNQVRKERKMVESNGMQFVNIPLNPFLHPNRRQIKTYYKIIDNPNNLPVLVHCKYGQDRTGIMTALYRVKVYNWDYNKAYDEMIAFGYHKTLYSRQKHFLWEYIKEVNVFNSIKQTVPLKRKA